ncbi:MAG: TIGR02302 family protein [Rhizobiales bacterium]|nr:TIGR02302 family protein [Hyphomicrobiales bacterium]OJY43522.1 MAG: TIGR02302 family protein [Rhizobiales bacterium 64-17]
MDGQDQGNQGRETTPSTSFGAALAQALKRARGALLWERVWPPLATLATVVGLFLAVSWIGLWGILPPLGRAIGLGLFALVALAALVPLLRLRPPTEGDALRRLDRVSGIAHRPATAVTDTLAGAPTDPVALALWEAHRQRMAEAARALKAGWPSPRLALRDPMALRVLVLLLVAVTFFAASGERTQRIATAFDWRGVIAPANFRVDAWVTPPAYTGRAPVLLPGLRPGEPTPASGPAFAVPAGSTLIVRASGGVSVDITRTGGLEPVEAKQDGKSPAQTPAQNAASQSSGAQEQHFSIAGDGEAHLRGAGRDLTWRFTAIPDRAPTIALAKDPEPQARGSLLLAYKMEDDYGVVEAHARFTRKDADPKARPLYDAPDVKLILPQARTRNGAAQTIKDLSEHPWAGAEVEMTLTARDEANNEGRSEPFEFTLPQRIFVKPMARALIEQRRVLALNADAKPLVLTALEALTIAPEKFEPDTRIYLGLRSLYYDLTNARTDDGLRDVAARLWAMAVAIEDGNVSDAEQALRQAQEALRQALERGASEEELKKLMDQLRAALNQFMQALAEEARKNPQQLARPLDRNARVLTPQDLKNMLDRMEQMARSGNRDAARRMLDELQQMLENLQTARPGQQQQMDGDDDMTAQLNELQDMIRKQQQLRDRTFREGQDQRRERQRGQRGQQGNQQMGSLQQDQKALRDRLQKLLDAMKQRGMNPDMGQQPGDDGDQQQGQGENGELGDADGAMGDAQGQLGDGDAEGAVGSQGRALDAMRKGAQNLAQQMQQQGQSGPGPNGQPGRGQQRAQQNTDPLGRPLRGRDYGDDTTVKVPGEIDVQRARKILEELRKRFGENYRPQLELDYIERLLKDF